MPTFGLGKSLDDNQATVNSSLSLILMQAAQCRTLWCLPAVFNWLDSERAFYNPDLGSSSIFVPHFCCSLISKLLVRQRPFSAVIVISWTIRKVRGQRFNFDENFTLDFSCLLCLTAVFHLSLSQPVSLSFWSLTLFVLALMIPAVTDKWLIPPLQKFQRKS